MSDGDHPHDSKVKSAQHLFMYQEGSDRYPRGLMALIPMITDKGLMDPIRV